MVKRRAAPEGTPAGDSGIEPDNRPQMRKLVQRQARALGDPTRFEIFRLVADASAPVRIASLAKHFPFDPSAIRQHLAKLCDAGLLVEELASGGGVGRPPLQYRLAPAAMDVWGSAGPYEFLSLRLLEVTAGRSAIEAGAGAGRRLAASYRPDANPLDVVEAEMARRGFEPRRERRPRSVEVVLERCPFQEAASADPDVVCQIHRGLAEGILEAMGGEFRVSKLVAYDPRRAGCRLQLKPAPALRSTTVTSSPSRP
jgi:predicted ArsR family transcriptional regulator